MSPPRALWSTILTLSLAVASARGAGVPPPEDFSTTYDELSALVDASTGGPMAVARGTYLASRFYTVGPAGLPPTRKWFRRAETRGRAATAALFLALHGSGDDHHRLRRGLESDPRKHRWLYGVVGNERNLDRSLREADPWAPLLRSFPGSGCRALGRLLLESPDPLVRRGGLWVGYWFADASYWSEARHHARDDGDADVRAAAELILSRAPPPVG